MSPILFYKRLGCLGAVLVLAGCDRGASTEGNGVRQTAFPGQVSAGGSTSGAAMGGTTTGAASSQAAPSAPSAPAELKKQQAAEQATREKQELVASMDRLAMRWRARATDAGWAVHPATPVAAVSGIAASANLAGSTGQPGGQLGAAAAATPVRSEKLGTALPSADVKDPSKKGK